MESWIYYAVIAAVFIVVRDVFGKKISSKYTFIEYLGYASIITALAVWIYIFSMDIQIKPLNYEYLGLILLRLLVVYLIIEPALYFCVTNCKNIGEASAIINLNVLFAFLVSCYLYNSKFDMMKLFGIFMILGGSYFVVM